MREEQIYVEKHKQKTEKIKRRVRGVSSLNWRGGLYPTHPRGEQKYHWSLLVCQVMNINN